MPQIPSAAALRREVDDWRSGLVQIFARLAADPDAGDDADFRSRLDTKLARLEAQIEQVLNAPESAGLSLRQAEQSYRLLGAHRGLSEAVISFARAAADIDWPRLREAHF